MEPIEVRNHCKNLEYPTRVTIIDFRGEYDDPEYTFSVQVQVEYNHVVDGKEENLVTFTFWTKEDTTWCHGEDEDGEPSMTEEEVEEWFEEGLHEDLSFHDLEGLEDLDLYEAGVPTEVSEDEYDEPEEAILSAIKDACGDIVDDFDCECADDYYYEEEEEDDDDNDEEEEEEDEDFSEEVEYVIETLQKFQQEIVKLVEKDPDDEYEKYLMDVLGDHYYAFGIYYKEGSYYLCFDNRFGKEIEYEEHGRKSQSPFTKEEIEDYVEYVYGEMLN